MGVMTTWIHSWRTVCVKGSPSEDLCPMGHRAKDPRHFECISQPAEGYMTLSMCAWTIRGYRDP
eukprot:11061067-Karenia_brevis.AAC.1